MEPINQKTIPPFKNFHTLIVWQDQNHTLNLDDMIGLIFEHVPDYKNISAKFPDGKLGAIQVPSISDYDWKSTAKQTFGNDILDDQKYIMRKLTIGSKNSSGYGVIYVFYELNKAGEAINKKTSVQQGTNDEGRVSIIQTVLIILLALCIIYAAYDMLFQQ